MKYVVQYTLPYEHRVMVGIKAGNEDEAIAKAETLFDQGDIWQDTAEVPLLLDGYDETGDTARFTSPSNRRWLRVSHGLNRMRA